MCVAEREPGNKKESKEMRKNNAVLPLRTYPDVTRQPPCKKRVPKPSPNRREKTKEEKWGKNSINCVQN
jgi:hypothetical protein